MAIELRVRRHPFSFIGDQDQSCDALHLKRQGTWKERLLDYTGGDPRLRDQAMAGMKEAGRPLGINFDYNCFINRQPIDSQRMLLFAAWHGKQEEYMTCLNRRHFTQGSQGESASKTHTILAAAKEAGLDAAEAKAFLDSGELRDAVWHSYGQMPKLGINACACKPIDPTPGTALPAHEHVPRTCHPEAWGNRISSWDRISLWARISP